MEGSLTLGSVDRDREAVDDQRCGGGKDGPGLGDLHTGEERCEARSHVTENAARRPYR
jgi:hypothetical protein